MLGLLIKPAIGVLDLFAKSFYGARNAAREGRVDLVLKPVRLPRFIASDGRLAPYDPELALVSAFRVYYRTVP